MQWNARSAVSNRNSLVKALSDLDIDIALLSETWFKPDRSYNFTGYKVIRQDRQDGTTGVAILIKNNIVFQEINLHNIPEDMQACAVKIINSNPPLTLSSIYCPPDVRLSTQNYLSLIDNFTGSIIIGGDFNGHHDLWGSYKINTAGSNIVNLLNQTDLVILNDGSQTKISRSSQHSAVDLTLVSPDMANIITWRVLPDTLGSDYFVILMSIDSPCQQNTDTIFPKTKWNTKKADWARYEILIDAYFSDGHRDFEDLNLKYNYFMSGIEAAASASIPTKKPFQPNNRRPSPPWWDSDCDYIVSQRKQALVNYSTQSTLENYIKVKKEMAASKKLLKKKAKNHWMQYCSKLNKNTPSRELWQQAKKMQRSIRNNTCQNLDWLDDFLNKIAPPSVSNNFEEETHYNQTNNDFFDTPITYEFNYILKNTSNTSPGYDQVTYDMLRNLPLSAKLYLIEIYNAVWLDGKDIDSWKNSIVLPILKPDKNPNIADSYRPITLLSCVLKTFERVIKNRLEFYFQSVSKLPSNQFGFKKGYSTTDAVSQLVTDIQITFSKNDYAGAAFLDLKGAYDSVDISLLRKKLLKMSLPLRVANMLCKLFLDRKIFIRSMNNTLVGPRCVSVGLPQGSVLSPILFNIYTSDLHEEEISYNIIQYADDFVIYNTNKTWEDCLSNTRLSISDISKKLVTMGFSLSPEKSSIVFFSRHRIQNMECVEVNNTSYPVADQVTYLGIAIDKKLCWKPFINNIVNRSNKGINFLKMIRRTWWGADPQTCLTFYKAYIRSIIDYGCIFYGSASRNIIKRIEIVQNTSLRLCAGAMCSTPVEPLRVEFLEPPLMLRRAFLAEKFVI
nr:unnamed protein product [Callosobruchus analis]